MKHSKTIKFITSSIIASALLVGCSSASVDENYITNSGVAIDPELQGAHVFLDINKNGILDAGEPNTTTDDLGNYFLRIKEQNVGAPIIVKGGIDRVTKEEFTGVLSVISEIENTNLHITPLTTLVYQYKQANPNEDVEAIKINLAIQLGINAQDFDANIVEDGNEVLLKIALRIQKMAQGIADNSNENIEAIYADIANELQYTDLENALINVCDNKIADTEFANAQLKDLQHELSLVGTLLTPEQLALTMDNVEQNVTSSTTQAELDVDVYDDAELIISDDVEFQAQLRLRAFRALGLSDLDEATKIQICNNENINLENTSLEDMIELMMGDELGITLTDMQKIMLENFLKRHISSI